MIGGVDFTEHWQVRPSDVVMVVDAIAAAWPECVVEDGNERWVRPHEQLGRLPESGELFLYEDEHAKRAWDEHGGGDDRDERMVNVLWTPRSITIVAGSSGGVTGRLAGDALEMLRAWWCSGAVGRRAEAA